jgi:hypothetical protein
MSGKLPRDTSRVGVVISGGNIDTDLPSFSRRTAGGREADFPVITI